MVNPTVDKLKTTLYASPTGSYPPLIFACAFDSSFLSVTVTWKLI